MTEIPRMHDPLGRGLPNSAEIPVAYDPDQLRAEISGLSEWGGAPLAAVQGRRILALHSLGGDPNLTDTGGPSLQDYAATPWLRRLPALRKALRSLPAPLRSVRLMALSPGARFTGLQSAKCGPPWGMCRLHLPIVSGAGARAVFVEDSYRWSPGTLSFAASWRQHALVNDEGEELVHLVIDLYHTAELARLFPQRLQARLTAPASLELRPRVALSPDEVRRYACRFPLPESFANWEQPGHFLPRNALRGIVTAEIAMCGGAPRLVLAGQSFCALEHLGQGEFRMRGWSDERTLQVEAGPRRRMTVVIRAREGANTYSTSLPAMPVG
ncbi:aspartyl/asparaginyl beta-hydroxylase domain-containing protein [Streptomyces sp. NPDC006529]|uniref:aspartyl/asparaginyl beta-hydroxylase domain-containing protein n=1 Tax=Streptomyces sp. NPDC006529 TaxID=3157177 RepID=UPI00339F74EE